MKTPDSRFYIPEIKSGISCLDENESTHAVRVCRAVVGDILQLCDGKGHFADAEITKADAKSCEVKIEKIESIPQRTKAINLAIACLKDDALEEVVFHAAQTEVNTVYFIRTDFSQEPKNSDLHKLVHRSELKSLVSLKQSKKPWMTKIEGPITLDEWMKAYNGDLILCDIDGNKSINVDESSEGSITLLVGPEGGFSPRELDLIKNFDRGQVHALNLGKTRLRARTAAIVALGKIL